MRRIPLFNLALVLPLLGTLTFCHNSYADSPKKQAATTTVIEDENLIAEPIESNVDAAQAAPISEDEDDTSNQASTESDKWYRSAYAAYEDKKYPQALVAIEKAIALYPEYSNYYDLKAYIHIKLEDYNSAIKTAGTALALFPNNPEFYELKGNCYDSLNNPEQALAAYRKMFEFRNSIDGNQSARWYNNYLVVLRDQKHFDEAIKVYKTYLQAIEDGEEIDDTEQFAGDVHLYGSLVYKYSGDSAGEMEALNAAIETNPDFSGYYVNRGSLFHNLKKYTDALADYNKGIALDKKSKPLHYNRALLYIELENHQKAMQDLLQAKKLGMNDDTLHLNLGNAYRGLKQYEKALSAYQMVLSLNPDNKEVQNNMANVYKAMGKPELASAAYQQATLGDSKVEIPFYNQAYDLMKKDKFSEAVPLLKKSLQAKPDFIEAYNQLGICYNELKQYDLAVDTYTKGLALDAKYSVLLINRASVYKNQQRLDLAKNDYLSALKYDPGRIVVYYLLGKMYRTVDTKLANDYFQLANEANVSDVEYFIDYTAFLLDQGEMKKALLVGEKGTEFFPESYSLLINLASAYAETGDHKKNEVTLKKAIALDPDDDSGHYNLGNHYFLQKKDLAQAEKSYLSAISKNPELNDAYLNLSSVYTDMGKQDMAFSMYEKLLKRNPDNFNAYYNRGAYYMQLGMTNEAAVDFDKSFALMDKALAKEKNNAYELNKLQSHYSLLKAQAYQVQKRYELANTSYASYLNFNPGTATVYSNYAHCLLETGDLQKALLNFEKSYALNKQEIDNVVGLVVTHYLLNNKSAVSKYKSAIRRDFSSYSPNPELLNVLSQEGYSYTEKFQRLWNDVTTK